MNKSRGFLVITLLFIGGVLTGSSFGSALLIGINFLIFVLVIFLLGKRGILLAGIFIITFSIGVLFIQKAEADKQILNEFDEVNFPITLTGYISNDPVEINGKQYFNFKGKVLIVPDFRLEISDMVRITSEILPEYQYGDSLMLQGFLVEGRIRNPEIQEVDFDTPFYTPVYRRIFELKDKFTSSIDKSILEPNASFINGILLGERAAIPQDLKDDFQKTGMIHILAISGYNVTIIVSLIYGLFLLFMKRNNAFWFAIIGIFIFTVLTGASASVVRAAIMGSLVLLAYKEGRMYSSGSALSFTAALMILADPLVIKEDIGFLLSFGATIGMLYLVPILERMVKRIPEFYGAKEAAVTTTAAQIMILPLIIFFFGAVSPISILVNIIVLPLIPFAMLFGFLTGLVGLFNTGLASIIGYLPWLITAFQIKVIQFFGNFELISITFGLPMLIFLYLVLIYWIARMGVDKR